MWSNSWRHDLIIGHFYQHVSSWANLKDSGTARELTNCAGEASWHRTAWGGLVRVRTYFKWHGQGGVDHVKEGKKWTIVSGLVYGKNMQENPWFLPSNMLVSCKCSLKPIHWYWWYIPKNWRAEKLKKLGFMILRYIIIQSTMYQQLEDTLIEGDGHRPIHREFWQPMERKWHYGMEQGSTKTMYVCSLQQRLYIFHFLQAIMVDGSWYQPRVQVSQCLLGCASHFRIISHT